MVCDDHPVGGLGARAEFADGESQVRGQVVALVQQLREGAKTQGHVDIVPSDTWLKYYFVHLSFFGYFLVIFFCNLPSS